mmetsp:Transcript_10989/g.7660  ORF Transcript_10989/g.7660 Transcript_10989/m.7660 type:complete len:113 (+) Transcript_10989:67-405(+)
MVIFAIMTLFAGILTDKYNRRNIMCFALFGWSLCSVGSGFVSNYYVLLSLRMLVGTFQGLFTPAAYGLISDYLPPEKRTIGNSFVSLGIYGGVAMVNFSILLIDSCGWRLCF